MRRVLSSFALAATAVAPALAQTLTGSEGSLFLLLPTGAQAVSKRLTTGINYKIVQIRFDCTGECSTVGPAVESSRAVDVGAQYEIEAGAPLTFGAAIRNLGGRLNSSETNARNPLPTQVELGTL